MSGILIYYSIAYASAKSFESGIYQPPQHTLSSLAPAEQLITLRGNSASMITGLHLKFH